MLPVELHVEFTDGAPAEERWDGREETIGDIPFGETRTYVRRVLDTMDTYIWLYDDGEQVSKTAESN